MMIWDWDCSIKFCRIRIFHPSVNQTLLSAGKKVQWWFTAEERGKASKE
jgi:hypothetical protein